MEKTGAIRKETPEPSKQVTVAVANRQLSEVQESSNCARAAAVRQISSEMNNQSSDQCDSLGPSTERFLIGSLLQPDEESMGNTSGEVDIMLQHASNPFQQQDQQPVLRRRDKGTGQTQLEEVAEIRSEHQSHRSQSEGRTKSIISVDNNGCDKSEHGTPSIAATSSVRSHGRDGSLAAEGSNTRCSNVSQAAEETTNPERIERLELQSRQRSASLSEMVSASEKESQAGNKSSYRSTLFSKINNAVRKVKKTPAAATAPLQESDPEHAPQASNSFKHSKKSTFSLQFLKKKLKTKQQPQRLQNNLVAELQSQATAAADLESEGGLHNEEENKDQMPFDQAQEQVTFQPSEDLLENSADCSLQFEHSVVTEQPFKSKVEAPLANAGSRVHHHSYPMDQAATVLPAATQQKEQAVPFTVTRCSMPEQPVQGNHNIELRHKQIRASPSTSQLSSNPFTQGCDTACEAQDMHHFQPVDARGSSSIFGLQSANSYSNQQPQEASRSSNEAQKPGFHQPFYLVQQPPQQQFNQAQRTSSFNLSNDSGPGIIYGNQMQNAQILNQQYYAAAAGFNQPSMNNMMERSISNPLQPTPNKQLHSTNQMNEWADPFVLGQSSGANNQVLLLQQQQAQHIQQQQKQRGSMKPPVGARFSAPGNNTSNQKNPFGLSVHSNNGSSQTGGEQQLAQPNRASLVSSQGSNPNQQRHSASSTQQPEQFQVLDKIKHDLEKIGERDLPLSAIQGSAFECCKDQTLSRWIQTKLSTTQKPLLDSFQGQFFEEICMEEQHLFEIKQSSQKSLMRDVFGNYVIQKMLETDQPSLLEVLFEKVLVQQILQLSLDQYGCRVLQKAIEVLDSGRQALVVQKLVPHCYRLIFDQNGNHVIQRCIQKCQETDLLNLLDIIFHQQESRVVELSTDVNGCRVMQRILERFQPYQIRHLLNEIITNLRELRTDSFGNYVVSHVLECGDLEDRCKIIDEIMDDLVELSLTKNGSNVVETCLNHAPQDRKTQIIDHLVSVPLTSPSCATISDLMQSKFGNFVVQRVYAIADQSRQDILLGKIKTSVAQGKVSLRKGPEQHVFKFLEKQYGITFDPSHYPCQASQVPQKQSGDNKNGEAASGRPKRKSNPKPFQAQKNKAKK